MRVCNHSERVPYFLSPAFLALLAYIRVDSPPFSLYLSRRACILLVYSPHYHFTPFKAPADMQPHKRVRWTLHRERSSEIEVNKTRVVEYIELVRIIIRYFGKIYRICKQDKIIEISNNLSEFNQDICDIRREKLKKKQTYY